MRLWVCLVIFCLKNTNKFLEIEKNEILVDFSSDKIY